MNKTLSANSYFFFTAAFIGFTASTIYLIPQTAPLIYLRYFSTLIFALFLTGYTLTQMLFTEKDSLDPALKAALSLGSSLAFIPLAAVVLNSIPCGIGLNSSFALLTLLTVSFAFRALAKNSSANTPHSNHDGA